MTARFYIIGIAFAIVISLSVLASCRWQRTADPNGLTRYEKDNDILGPAAPGEVRVVFIGDSITENWNLDGYFPGRPFINRGINSQTTHQILQRFPSDVLALRPRVVVIQAGTNDIAEGVPPGDVERNIAAMAGWAKDHGIAVILASLLPVRDIKTRTGLTTSNTALRPPEKIRTVNERLRSYAGDHKLIYIDYYSAMVGDDGYLMENLSEDGLHPNDEGYKAMAPLALEAVQKALS